MLFSTVEEFRGFIPASKNLSFEDLKPMLETAELDDIIPFLGQEQYDALNGVYDSGDGTMTDTDKDLLKRVRRPLANIAIARFSAFGNLNIGKSGFTVTSTEHTAIASQWRVNDLKSEVLKEYFQGTERMLQYLEANTGLYPVWAASSAFTQFRECFINTADDFNNYFFINSSRRTFLSLRPKMKQVEEYILSITGQSLFDEIKSQILLGTVSAANLKLLKLIKPAVANQSMVEALPNMQVLFTDYGPQLVETSNSLTQVVQRAVDGTRMEKLITTARETADSKRKELQDFLYLNHATYPLFEADSTVYIPTSSDTYNDTNNSTFGFGL